PAAALPSGVPLATEVVDDEPPPARPTSSILDEVELAHDAHAVTGPAVELRPDGSVVLTGGGTTLRLSGRWLRAKTTALDGPPRLTYLRLSKLEAAVLGGRPEVD